MILIIDNYDSFTFNLVHLVGVEAPDMLVRRNDRITLDEITDLRPDGVLIGPGPCSPNEAGISLSLCTYARKRGIPLLGVCLGHQAIAQAAGATVGRAGRLMHGRTSPVIHDGNDALFEGIPTPFTATRYHSLCAIRGSVPEGLRVLARAGDDEEIMAIRWGDHPIWGVQFHPESIASEHGDRLIRNFLSALPAKAAA